MPKAPAHKWEFTARFKRHAFGWRSSALAVTRLKEALSELRKVAKTQPAFAAEGAVQLLERLFPALEKVDSSSGALGGAIHAAVVELAPLIGSAQVDAKTRGVDAAPLESVRRGRHALPGVPGRHLG